MGGEAPVEVVVGMEGGVMYVNAMPVLGMTGN